MPPQFLASFHLSEMTRNTCFLLFLFLPAVKLVMFVIISSFDSCIAFWTVLDFDLYSTFGFFVLVVPALLF